ncbi:MAG: glycosyltransferase family 4 protein [Legionellales bacterium]|nr:glycosyltransferase family 4 protein [Legionellales bacterium]
MKFLILSDNYYPEMNARARIMSELSEHFVKLGNDVTVITSCPNFPRGKPFPGYKNKLYQTETINGVSVERVKTYMYSNKGFLLRVIDFTSFMFSGLIAGLFHRKIDVVISSNPQFFSAIAGCLLSIIKRKPFVLFLCDLWPDSVVSVGILENSVILKVIKLIEKWIYKKSSLILTSSPEFNDYLRDLNINSNKVHLSISGSDNTFFYKRNKANVLEKKYNISNKFVAGYIGTMGMAHNTPCILDIAKKIQHIDDIVFFMIGDGVDRDSLAETVINKSHHNVIVDGPFPQKDIPKYFSIIDISLVILADIETNKTVIPSKLIESMAMGKPIILYAPEGAASKMLIKAQCGLFIEVGQVDKFIDCLLTLKENTSLYQNFSDKALQYARKFTREKQAKIVNRYIIEVLGKNHY